MLLSELLRTVEVTRLVGEATIFLVNMMTAGETPSLTSTSVSIIVESGCPPIISEGLRPPRPFQVSMSLHCPTSKEH